MISFQRRSAKGRCTQSDTVLCHDREQGWPEHIQDFPIKQGQEFIVTSDQKATATPTLLPINHAVRLPRVLHA